MCVKLFAGTFQIVTWLCKLDFFFQAEDGIRDADVTGVQTCALPIYVDELRSDSEVARVVESCFDLSGPEPLGHEYIISENLNECSASVDRLHRDPSDPVMSILPRDSFLDQHIDNPLS